jgi:C4-dicarboxylate-specific signal transduction histidine kinase
MERIVKSMEGEAASAVWRLRVYAAMIAAAVVACLLALGRWVLHPATDIIRQQVEELESRVAKRTRELATAVNSLECEFEQRKQSELKSQRLGAQLAHASRVWTMGHLTAGLAHEVNQPLATIANYVEACDVELIQSGDGPKTERLRHHLGLAKQAALRAGQIVRRMRNFVRPTAPEVVDVRVADLICEVVELCRTEVRHSDCVILLDLCDERSSVAVDPIQIQQVLVNLIQNSLQAMTESGTGSKQIEIRTSLADDSVVVQVTDTGPGFDASNSDSLFTPFYTTKRDGLGIGLAVCRAIVEEHGGKIWAGADSRKGATISFTLPLSEGEIGFDRARRDCVCR